MAKSEAIDVNPSMLRWARETAGMPVDLAAAKLKISSANLGLIESGEERPRIAQLKKASEIYKRPLASFFMPAPPAVVPTPRDFRVFPKTEHARDYSSTLLLEIRKARWKRTFALEVSDELERKVEPFTEELTLTTLIADAAKRIREYLGVSIKEQSQWRDGNTALARWISALEAKQILAFQTSRVELAEMRGVSLFEDRLPIVLLNGRDAARARVFTLFHEFCHLLLRSSGTCEPLSSGTTNSADAKVEAYCNAFAGEFLVPTEVLRAQPLLINAVHTEKWSIPLLHELSLVFSVSAEVILRRLYQEQWVGQSVHHALLEQLREQYAEIAKKRKEKKPGGPPPPIMAARDNGRLFSGMLLSALQRDIVSEIDVTNYLGLRTKHFEALADLLERPGAEAIA